MFPGIWRNLTTGILRTYCVVYITQFYHWCILQLTWIGISLLVSLKENKCHWWTVNNSFIGNFLQHLQHQMFNRIWPLHCKELITKLRSGKFSPLNKGLYLPFILLSTAERTKVQYQLNITHLDFTLRSQT